MQSIDGSAKEAMTMSILIIRKGVKNEQIDHFAEEKTSPGER